MSCLEIVYRREALVSLNVAIYFLAKEEYKTVALYSSWQIPLALESVAWIINSSERRLKENPGASLKLSISFNHQRKLVEIWYTQRRWDLWVHQEYLFFHFLPIFPSACDCVLQAQSCPGKGESKGRLATSMNETTRFIIQRTSSTWPPLPIKIQTLGVHKGVKKVNEGGVALENPNLCIFMDMSAATEGLTSPCPLQDPGGDGSEPVTNEMGCQLGEDELLGWYTVMMIWWLVLVSYVRTIIAVLLL